MFLNLSLSNSQALWGAAAELAESHGGFEEMHLNAGNFQNVAQMHLKAGW